jgi:hypothetical protein
VNVAASASAGAATFESSTMTAATASAMSGARLRQASAMHSTSAEAWLTARSPANFDSVAISRQ